MHDDVDRSIKTRTLRDSAAEFRRTAEAGENARLNIMAACMLEQRADRIDAGEDDHSAIPLTQLVDLRAESRTG